MEKGVNSAPKISRRQAIKVAPVGASILGKLATGEISLAPSTHITVAPPFNKSDALSVQVLKEQKKPAPTANALKPVESVAPQAETGLLDGKEREFKLKQLGEFLRGFVDANGFKVLVEQGFYVEDALSVRTRKLPNSEITTFFADIEGEGRVTVASFENSKTTRVKQATIYMKDRGGRDMDGFALGVKSLLKNKNAEFEDEDLDDSDNEDIDSPMQSLKSQQTLSPDLSNPESELNRRLRANIPASPSTVTRDPVTNESYMPTLNYVQLYPDGQVIFYQQQDVVMPSLVNSPI